MRIRCVRSRLTIAAAIAAAVLLTNACGAVRYPTYHTLEIAPEPPAAAGGAGEERRALVVAVRRFDAAGHLRDGRLTYRETPDTIGFYDYHRWAADPGAAVTSAMIDALRSARLFSAVVPYDSQAPQACVLSGRLARLEEVDYGGGVHVEARLVVELVDRSTGQMLWQGEASESSNLETRTVASVVNAMSHAVAMSIHRLIARMDQEVPLSGSGSQS